MSRTHATYFYSTERPELGIDLVSRQPSQGLRAQPPLDYYGESQMAGEPGGDILDFIPFEPNGLASVVGQVSGQDAAAAELVLPKIRTFLRARMSAGVADLRLAVRDLNRRICDIAPDSFYATLFCAAIHPERRELRYVNAGHEPALLLRPGIDRVYRLESTGTVLGLTTRAAYGCRTIALEPGDILAAFTEGVAEASDPAGQIFGASRLLKVLRQHAGARASELVASVMDALRQFADFTKPPADRTLAVVRFNGLKADELAFTAA